MNLFAQMELRQLDYSGLRVMLPLSGGINSGALLCALGREVSPERWPCELHLICFAFQGAFARNIILCFSFDSLREKNFSVSEMESDS